jgi:hypothetical protein
MRWKHIEKENDEWERHFAFLPVTIGTLPIQDGQIVVWLEFVERKWIDSYDGSIAYEYRLIERE